MRAEINLDNKWFGGTAAREGKLIINASSVDILNTFAPNTFKDLQIYGYE